jgi:hypothetical protein
MYNLLNEMLGFFAKWSCRDSRIPHELVHPVIQLMLSVR